jgi:hypothetical protein
MSAIHALKLARAAGIRTRIDGDALMLDAGAAPPPEVIDLLARHKAQVIALLRPGRDGWSGEDWQAFFDERAGIAEFDGGLPRDQAEAFAFACCIAEWLSRNPVRSPPGRCLGCRQIEEAEKPLLPFVTTSTGHAWLLAGCWPAGRQARQAKATAALAVLGIKPLRTNE